MKYYLLQMYGDFDIPVPHTLLTSECEVNIKQIIESFKSDKSISVITQNMEDDFIKYCKKNYGMGVEKIKTFTIDET